MVTDVQDTVTSGALPIAMAVALLAGLVSFASPCVLPLVPGFLGYVTGLSDESLAERKRHRMVLGALLFVLGFTVVFMITTVVVAGVVGATLIRHREVLERVGAVTVLATTSGSDSAVTRGVVLALLYSLGLGAPFLLIAAGYERFGRVSAFLRKRQRGIQLFGGALLFVVGILLVTGLWESITRHVQSTLVSGF